jgi:bacterioferritin
MPTKSQNKTLSKEQRETIIAELCKAYNMEIETVANYIACSTQLDGMLAQSVKQSLGNDVAAELGHAQQLAHRIKVLGGRVPGSQALKMNQSSLQPPKNNVDVEAVIQGVIDAEAGAIEQYQKLISLTDGVDFVTQDLCITLKGDEEEHLSEFEGFQREYNAMRKMFHAK